MNFEQMNWICDILPVDNKDSIELVRKKNPNNQWLLENLWAGAPQKINTGIPRYKNGQHSSKNGSDQLTADDIIKDLNR